MGVKYSSLNALLIGESLDNRYVTYKLEKLDDYEYFKVEDMLDYNVK
jgi:hypothetical protein